MVHCPPPPPPPPKKKNFFWYKPLLLPSPTYWPFSLCKILKKSYSGSRVMRIHHFWAQNGPSPPQVFFLKIIDIILIYLLALSFCKISKTFFQQIQSYDAQFLGPKWPISPNENFFKEPITEPCFFHICQKSKSDIYLLVKY